MKKLKAHWLALTLGAVLAATAGAQAPVIPGAPPVAPPPPPAPAAAPAAAAPAKNIFSMLCMTPEQMAACKACFCNSVIGKMFSGLLKPVSVFSGGLIEDRCPAAQVAADLAKPPDSADGAAARIKADEAAAKARRANVRYLGTVDCHYWPEAEEALINALRADRNECVRWEAAIVLGRGCCCTKKTIEALAIVVSGDDRDSNPSEKSDRVKNAAFISLNNCLAGQPPAPPGEIIPEKDKDKPGKDEPIPPPVGAALRGQARAKTDGVSAEVADAKGMVKGASAAKVTPAEYYARIQMLPLEKVLESARRAVAQTGQMVPTTPTGSKGVFDIVMHAINGPQTAPSAQAPQAAPAQHAEPVVARTPAPAVVPAHARKVELAPVQPIRNEVSRPVHVPPPPKKVEAPMLPPRVEPSRPPMPSAPPVKFETMPQSQKPSGPAVEFGKTPVVKQAAFATQRPTDSGVQNAGGVQPQTGQGNPVVRIVWHDAPASPAAVQPAQRPPVNVQQLVTGLQSGRTVEERQRAAEGLGNSAWLSHPEVSQALTTASQTDQSSAVRATCLRYLSRVNGNR